jgi:hypothetical protein
MKAPIDWQAQARQLRAKGKSSDEIAVVLHQGPSVVREVLKGTPRPPAETLGARQAELASRHAPRTPRTILDRLALPSAAAEFAAGLIDRAELMRRISK